MASKRESDQADLRDLNLVLQSLRAAADEQGVLFNSCFNTATKALPTWDVERLRKLVDRLGELGWYEVVVGERTGLHNSIIRQTPARITSLKPLVEAEQERAATKKLLDDSHTWHILNIHKLAGQWIVRSEKNNNSVTVVLKKVVECAGQYDPGGRAFPLTIVSHTGNTGWFKALLIRGDRLGLTTLYRLHSAGRATRQE